MGAAGLVHRLNHAGFEQSARRGERDFVRRFVFRGVVPSLFRRSELRFHASDGVSIATKHDEQSNKVLFGARDVSKADCFVGWS